ncbi:MAG: VanW family protein [Actinomycetota bacterium]|nr:VanW family protein [Actinomycetota bacterium]
MSSKLSAPTTTVSPATRVSFVTRYRWWLLAAGLFALVLLIYGISRLASAGQVLGSVTADRTQLGGLTASETESALAELEATLGESPAVFVVEGIELELEPLSIGFDVNERVMTQAALSVGRSGNPFGEFWWWLSRLFSSTEIPVQARIDPAALETVLLTWDDEAIASPPFPGAITIEGTEVLGEPPRSGRQIDRNQAPNLVLAQASTSFRAPTPLPVVEKLPTLTIADIEAGVRTGELLLAGPITLRNPERERQVTFSIEQLAAALQPIIGETAVDFAFDPEAFAGYLEPLRADLEDPPVDAELQVDGDFVLVIPGRKGTDLNPEATAESALLAARSAARSGLLPIDESVDPDVTTRELEALNIDHKVSEFTTYHDCCQNRVENIHLIADAVDGIIVPAGATFSLNETVGERTIEKGYLEDGAIVAGRLEKEIGGGVSQFATTFYNAVFWGGYEDIAHKPHSFYFSRYPLGIEATISWPLPDIQFGNNTGNAILIRTFYTNTSITVVFYSNNDGRILVGEQSGGNLHVVPTAEGGPDARHVSAEVSDRYDYRDPAPPRYIGDFAIAFPEQKREQSAAQGYKVDVTRFITVGDQTIQQDWTVVYSPRQEIILIHPCQIEGSGVSCPTTTLTPTTIPSDTVPTTTTG